MKGCSCFRSTIPSSMAMLMTNSSSVTPAASRRTSGRSAAEWISMRFRSVGVSCWLRAATIFDSLMRSKRRSSKISMVLPSSAHDKRT